METHGAPIDHVFRIEGRGAMDLAAKSEFGIFVRLDDARREASTSWVLFPIGETMPIPVTTTRLISVSWSLWQLTLGGQIGAFRPELQL
jgi:hypothetical protein